MKNKKSIGYFLLFLTICSPVLISSHNLSRSNDIIRYPQLSTGNDNKSIILMIGDGMGHEHLKLAKWVEVGKQGSLSIENLPFVNNVTTFCADSPITDSAAAATAIATGYKTNYRYLSVLPNLNPVETILEIAQKRGKSSGVVSTTEITHATPAAFMTHVPSRFQTTEIARQIVEESGVDVIMGGGRSHFTGEQINQMQNNGYQYIMNNSGLQDVSSGKIFGLFADEDLPYEFNRNYTVTPSLANMTNTAIGLLSQDPDGFFLIVEGGKIDHAAHDNNKRNVALETIEFLSAIEKAISYVKSNNNTLLIITADHETGGLEVLSENLNSTLPSQNRAIQENRNLRLERAKNVTVSWLHTGHTNTNVPFYAYGIEDESYENFTVIDNTEIFDIMISFINSESQEQPNNGPSDVIIIVITSIAIATVSCVTYLLYRIFNSRNKYSRDSQIR